MIYRVRHSLSIFCRMGNIVNHLRDQQPELCIKYGTLFLITFKRKLSGTKNIAMYLGLTYILFFLTVIFSMNTR